MSTLIFTDGISINTDGPLRKLRLSDGWYVVGDGLLIPCYDEQEADETIQEMKGD